MFDWKEFEKAKQVLREAGDGHYHETLGQHHLSLRPKDLRRWVEFIRDDLGYQVLVDIICIDRQLENRLQDFELVYHFLNMGNHQRLNLHLYFDQLEVIPGIDDFFAHADWLEREQKEMFNLRFDRQQVSLLLPHTQSNWPLLKNAQIKSWPPQTIFNVPVLRMNPNKSEPAYPEESYVWKEMGLLSNETMGNFEWQVCFNPVEVVESKINIGFHHQGFEKLMEKKDWMQVMHLVDRINYGASPTYSIIWAKCLEDLFRIKLPERAQAIRIVMLELARIADHLTVLFEITFAEAKEEYKLFINAREKVYELFEKFCGHRQCSGFVRLGGVKEDLPHGWIMQYQEMAAILNKNLPVINQALIAKRDFKSKLSGPAINPQTILQWGVTGPAMRASGLNFDLRKSQPFYFYQEVDFDIPVGIYGSVYDRYLIRLEEIFQSLRIITQVIDNLPLGQLINSEVDLPPLELMAYINQLPTLSDFHTSSIESPGGEAGIAVIMGENKSLQRIKFKTPSLNLAQALPPLILGLRAEQLRSAVASLGIRKFELDR